jgi:hypothetical protein
VIWVIWGSFGGKSIVVGIKRVNGEGFGGKKLGEGKG